MEPTAVLPVPGSPALPASAFAAALADVRAGFPLPEERIAREADDEIEALVEGLCALRGGPDAWGRRAALFPRRSLSQLFPALLKAEDPELLDRIERILEARATRSLHDLGWAWFQHHYADPRMQEGFRRLHAALLKKAKKACPTVPPDDGGPLDGTLPVRLHAALKASGESDVDAWLERTGLLPGTSLERAVLALYFSGCPDEGFFGNVAAFERMLPGLDAATGAQVLGHYLREHRLGPRFRPLNAALLAAIGAPDSGHSAWSGVSERSKARYWKWLVFRTVEDHLSGNPRKFGLLVRYVPYMESVRVLDEDVLVMGFEDFYLVDDKGAPHLTYFYEKAVFELWLEQLAQEQKVLAEMAAEAGAGESGSEGGSDGASTPAAVAEPTIGTFLAMPGPKKRRRRKAASDGPALEPVSYGDETPESFVPSLPAQPAKRVILESFKASAVLVDYQEVGLLYARDFLDDTLGIGRRSESASKGGRAKGAEPEVTRPSRLF